MTSAELRCIVEAMTSAPWRMDHLDMRSPSGYRVLRISGFEAAADIESIVTIANHADALVALVEAVERRAEAGRAYNERMSQTIRDGHGPPQRLWVSECLQADEAIAEALAAVHAVRSTP